AVSGPSGQARPRERVSWRLLGGRARELSLVLRAVHRFVGGPQQALLRLLGRASHSDSEARLDAQDGGTATSLEPVHESSCDLLGAGAGRVGKQDRELVPADPERLVARPELRVQEPPDSDEAIVPRAVTVTVVHL